MATLLGAALLQRDPSAVLAKGKGKGHFRVEAKTKRRPCCPGGHGLQAWVGQEHLWL
jgi:hypothetical protein